MVFGKVLWTLGRYDGLLKQSLVSVKNQGHKALGKELADAAAQVVVEKLGGSYQLDAILAVPASQQGQKFRGFSLPQMIEQRLLKITDWPTLPPALRRSYRSAGKTSRGLSREERQNRARKLSDTSEGKTDGGTLLLIDDVVTTGSTLGRCIEQATAQGFEEIVCFALAEHNLPEDI